MPRRAPRCSISTRRPSKSGARSPATPRGRPTRRRRRCPRSSSSSPKVSRCPDVRRDIAMAHGLDLVETEQGRGAGGERAGGGKDPDFWRAFEDGEVKVIGDEPANTEYES